MNRTAAGRSGRPARRTDRPLYNVVGSTIAREVDDALYIRAEPEIGVAAIKTFTSQVATLTLLAHRTAEDLDGVTPRDDAAAFLGALERLPDRIEQVLEETTAEWVSEIHVDRVSYFFIGRDFEHPVALKGALKFKEITTSTPRDSPPAN